jgi:hypothetical protein
MLAMFCRVDASHGQADEVHHVAGLLDEEPFCRAYYRDSYIVQRRERKGGGKVVKVKVLDIGSLASEKKVFQTTKIEKVRSCS